MGFPVWGIYTIRDKEIFIMRKSFLLGILALVLAFGLIGCDTGSSSSSSSEPQQNKLTVIGELPASITVALIYGSLDAIYAQEAPVAIGGNVTKSFAFYEPATGTMNPDLAKQWKNSGSFYILLSTGETEISAFISSSYISNGKVTFSGGLQILPWTKFVPLAEYEEPTVIHPFTLTVTGIDGSVNILGGAVIANLGDTSSQATVAVAINNSGIFKFYSPINPTAAIPMPNLSSPWAGDASYSLVLSPLPPSKQWIYTADKGFGGLLTELFDFTTGSATVPWTEFTQAPF